MAIDIERLSAALAQRYAVEREIGAGGTAVVFQATDLQHDRPVAVKVLHPELAAALGAERFLREIHIAAKLNHPHILPLFDSGQAGAFIYFVMPLVEGETLRDRIDREAQLSIEETLTFTEQIAAALDYAHTHDIVHRDVKPANILLAEGQAVIADFGIARAITTAGGKELTQTGFVVGSPSYMSPEQASGEPVDQRSDVYSLGCVVYEMLAGQPPFTGQSYEAVLAQQLLQPTPSVRTMRPEVAPETDAAIAKALAKPASERFSTASAFAEALRRSSGQTVRSTPRRLLKPLAARRVEAFGRKQCPTCHAWLNAATRLCNQCGRDQRRWYKRPAILLGVIGALSAIPIVVGSIAQFMPERARITYGLLDFGEGELRRFPARSPQFPEQPETVGPMIFFDNQCDSCQKAEVKSPAVRDYSLPLAILDSAQRVLLGRVIDDAKQPVAGVTLLCIHNRTVEQSDSLEIRVEVPGWLISVTTTDLGYAMQRVDLKTASIEAFETLFRDERFGQRIGDSRWELRRAGLLPDSVFFAMFAWLEYLESPLGFERQLPFDLLTELQRRTRVGRFRDSLTAVVMEGATAGALPASRRSINRPEDCFPSWE